MKLGIISLVIVFALSACAQPTPPVDLVQTSVAQTLAVVPPAAVPTNTQQPAITNTPKPTATFPPTRTPRPTKTDAPAQSLDDLRQDMLDIFVNLLENGEGLEAVEEVTVVRFGDPGILEIELVNVYSAEDNQPDLSYDVIRYLSQSMIGGMDLETSKLLANGDDFIIRLTTYSNDGDYKYRSETSWEVMEKIASKQITYEEWVQLSNAGFRK